MGGRNCLFIIYIHWFNNFRILLLTAFVAVELYVSEEPILPIELFANRTVLASSLTNWFYTMSIFTTLFYVPIYYSSVIGLTPTENGLD